MINSSQITCLPSIQVPQAQNHQKGSKYTPDIVEQRATIVGLKRELQNLGVKPSFKMPTTTPDINLVTSATHLRDAVIDIKNQNIRLPKNVATDPVAFSKICYKDKAGADKLEEIQSLPGAYWGFGETALYENPEKLEARKGAFDRGYLAAPNSAKHEKEHHIQLETHGEEANKYLGNVVLSPDKANYLRDNVSGYAGVHYIYVDGQRECVSNDVLEASAEIGSCQKALSPELKQFREDINHGNIQPYIDAGWVIDLNKQNI